MQWKLWLKHQAGLIIGVWYQCITLWQQHYTKGFDSTLFNTKLVSMHYFDVQSDPRKFCSFVNIGIACLPKRCVSVYLMVWYLYIKWYFLSLSKHYTTTASFTDVLLALFPGLPQLQTFFPSYCKWSKLGTRLYSFTFDLNWPCYTSSALNLCAIHAALRFHFCVTLSKNADYANLCLFFSLLCTGIKVLSFSYKNIPIGLLWSAVQLALKNEEQFPPSFSTSACKCFVQSTISRFVEMISRLFCKLEIMQCMCNIACDWLMLYDGHTDSMCTASEKGW